MSRDAHDDAAETIRKSHRSEVEELQRALEAGEQRLEISERQRMKDRDAALKMEERLGTEAALREQRVRTEMEALIATLDLLKRGGVVGSPPPNLEKHGGSFGTGVGSVLHAMDEEIEEVSRGRLRAGSPTSGDSGSGDGAQEHEKSYNDDKCKVQEHLRVREADGSINEAADGTIEIWQHSPAYPALQACVPPSPAGWGQVGAGGGVELEEGQGKRGGEHRGQGGQYFWDKRNRRVDPGEVQGSRVGAESFTSGRMPTKQREMIDLIAATLAYNDVSPVEGFRLFDRDGDGKIGYDDLLLSLLDMPLSVSHPDVNALHCLLDRDRDGYVSEADWRAAIAAAHPESVLVDIKSVAAEEQRLKAEFEMKRLQFEANRLQAENAQLQRQIRQQQALLVSKEEERANLENVVRSRDHVERDLTMAHSDRLALEQVLSSGVP